MNVIQFEPATVSENAYRQIRTDILFGRLSPGAKLKLEGLKDSYSTSVSTLREILNRLSSEGLVLAEGQRGFQVAAVSAKDLKEIAAMRLLLENHAMALSFAAGDIDWEGRVVAAHHKLAQMEKHLIAGEREKTEAWKRYDFEFHHALVSACGSAALLETHAGFYDRYLRYQMVALVFRGKIAADEHEEMLKAALARDAATAQSILERHINGCVEYTLQTGQIG